MLVVLCVGRRMVVVVVVIRWWILWDLTVLGMVTVELGLHCVCYLCRVVQVGWMGLVRYQCGMAGREERGMALRRRFPSLAAKK